MAYWFQIYSFHNVKFLFPQLILWIITIILIAWKWYDLSVNCFYYFVDRECEFSDQMSLSWVLKSMATYSQFQISPSKKMHHNYCPANFLSWPSILKSQVTVSRWRLDADLTLRSLKLYECGQDRVVTSTVVQWRDGKALKWMNLWSDAWRDSVLRSKFLPNFFLWIICVNAYVSIVYLYECICTYINFWMHIHTCLCKIHIFICNCLI